MSLSSIRSLFNFHGVKVIDFSVHESGFLTIVELVPDYRVSPRCSHCMQKVIRIHSTETRLIRDLTISESMVLIRLHYRKVICPTCGIRVEHHDFVEPCSRVTKRFERFIFQLCQMMSISDVCRLTQLGWHQVKAIDKKGLTKKFSERTFSDLKLLCVDEFAVKKGHQYMTLVINHETGDVLHIAENRSSESLAEFFEKLTPEVRSGIEAIAMDMWDPYIKAVRKYCPHIKIIFDQFHVIKAFGFIIDEIRRNEFYQLGPEKGLLKNSRYLLLKNPQRLKPAERPKLRNILRNNRNLAVAYMLKEYLKRLWQYKYVRSAVKFMDYWCQLAMESGIPQLKKFVKMLLRYAYGIINHCYYKINTARIEGTINKIKVLKRRAYGYHDNDYFKLKIMQAFSTFS
jgi:transposase